VGANGENAVTRFSQVSPRMGKRSVDMGSKSWNGTRRTLRHNHAKQEYTRFPERSSCGHSKPTRQQSGCHAKIFGADGVKRRYFLRDMNRSQKWSRAPPAQTNWHVARWGERDIRFFSRTESSEWSGDVVEIDYEFAFQRFLQAGEGMLHEA
jgi:hypothetical protein